MTGNLYGAAIIIGRIRVGDCQMRDITTLNTDHPAYT